MKPKGSIQKVPLGIAEGDCEICTGTADAGPIENGAVLSLEIKGNQKITLVPNTADAIAARVGELPLDNRNDFLRILW